MLQCLRAVAPLKPRPAGDALVVPEAVVDAVDAVLCAALDARADGLQRQAVAADLAYCRASVRMAKKQCRQVEMLTTRIEKCIGVAKEMLCAPPKSEPEPEPGTTESLSPSSKQILMRKSKRTVSESLRQLGKVLAEADASRQLLHSICRRDPEGQDLASAVGRARQHIEAVRQTYNPSRIAFGVGVKFVLPGSGRRRAANASTRSRPASVPSAGSNPRCCPIDPASYSRFRHHAQCPEDDVAACIAVFVCSRLAAARPPRTRRRIGKLGPVRCTTGGLRLARRCCHPSRTTLVPTCWRCYGRWWRASS